MTNKYLYITLLALLGLKAEALDAVAQTGGVPRLVVSITIDQLADDYLEAFAPLYGENGFRRLMQQGLVYDHATHSFTPVDRASAMAALASGTTPYYNSIVGQQWLNRETLRPVGCVDDASCPGLLTSQTASPASIAVSTLADELKVATSGQALVHSIAPWREAAVLSGGHAADGAWWIDDVYGEWCTSQYYTKSIPQWLSAHNTANAPRLKAYEREWEPLNLQTASFNHFTQTSIERPFKHKFSGNRRHQQYKLSGLVNSDVTGLAVQCLSSTPMGSDRITDLLCLTYYAGPFDGRKVTDCQPELQDTYVRLDQELTRLINYVEQHVGRDNVLFALTSSGHEQPVSEDYQAYRVPSGNLYMNRTARLLNMYLGAIWGQGNYVEAVYGNQLYLNHKLLETRKISMGEALSRSQELVAMMEGVRNAYTSLQLLTDQNQQLQKIRNGFNPSRSGDIIIEPAPGWHVVNEDTQEDELCRAHYVDFPIIFYGAGIKAGRVETPVTADRIAPTIAHAIRIRAPNACQAEPLF